MFDINLLPELLFKYQVSLSYNSTTNRAEMYHNVSDKQNIPSIRSNQKLPHYWNIVFFNTVEKSISVSSHWPTLNREILIIKVKRQIYLNHQSKLIVTIYPEKSLNWIQQISILDLIYLIHWQTLKKQAVQLSLTF